MHTYTIKTSHTKSPHEHQLKTLISFLTLCTRVSVGSFMKPAEDDRENNGFMNTVCVTEISENKSNQVNV